MAKEMLCDLSQLVMEKKKTTTKKRIDGLNLLERGHYLSSSRLFPDRSDQKVFPNRYRLAKPFFVSLTVNGCWNFIAALLVER